jgi:hypothetical protein
MTSASIATLLILSLVALSMMEFAAAIPTAASSSSVELSVLPRLPIFDVSAFGAVGDGHTDDTTAVEIATSAWLTSPQGGVLLFPSGEYLLASVPAASAYINFCPPDSDRSSSAPSWSIEGQFDSASGAFMTTLVYNASAASLFRSQPLMLNSTVSFTLKDLSIQAFEEAASPTATAFPTISMTGTSGATITNLNVSASSKLPTMQ